MKRAGPVGSQIGTARYDAILHPFLDTNVIASVNGITWKLHKGTVESWTCISFVAPSEITNFNSDLKPFFSMYIIPSKPRNDYNFFAPAYLTENQGVSASQYLVQAQSGTEPFTGMPSVFIPV